MAFNWLSSHSNLNFFCSQFHAFGDRLKRAQGPVASHVNGPFSYIY